ncbi:ATP-binding protein [Streptomyces sp. 1331.2]|uniref:ATP-binding protein n=1 Tax=Streptomyces sp. 1331.2 TaxID=1938835 RepID=UPI000BD1CC03|nr:AAA family ATPase [Streptomyces sp. 1331.2]SOB80337.1 AAA ATPase domain-containing protein [Streptomyces sp. 1331.2]
MTEQQNELRAGLGSGREGDATAPRIRLRDRDAELRSVETAVDRLCREFAAGGTEIGDLLTFSGRPGIGKTSLLHEVRRIAKVREGATVLFARGGERQFKEPYHVLRQLLQPVLSNLKPDEFHQVMGTWEEVVGPAMGLKQPKAGARRLDPQGVRDGLDYVLTQLAPRRAPMVMIVDDLHWADAESLSWLAKFAVRSDMLPVLLVFAFRDDESDWPAETHRLRRDVLALKGRKHELNRLNLSSVTDMIRAELGDKAEDAFCYEFWNVVNGNPFEAGRLLDQVRDQELEPVEENSRQLRELAVDATGMTLKSWLDQLGASTLRFAWACAMLGTDIRIDLATRISTQSSEAARESIKQLRKQRVLTQAPNGNLEFVHPLIGSSIYNTMPDATRLGMHGIAAVEIENAGLGLLAASRHLVETHSGEGDDRIVKKLRRAAVEHQLIGAPEAAQRCLHRALEEPPADDIKAEVMYELGCSALLTDPVATVNQLKLALDPDEGPLRPELRVDATFRLSEVLAHSGELGEAALVCQDEAEQTADPAGRQRLQAASFMWHAFRKSEEDGPGRSARLGEMCRSLTGREAADRAVLAMRAWDLTLRGDASTEALALADEVLDGGRLPKGLGWTDTTWGFELPSMLSLTYIYNDRIAQAERLAADAIIQFELAGWSGAHRGFAYFLMGLARFRRGLLAEAEDFLRRAYRISERIGARLPLAWDAVGVLVDTLIARGRVEEAWELANDFGFHPPYHATAMVLPDAASLYGKLLVAKERYAGAAAALTEAGAQLEVRGWRNTVWAPWAGHLAVALADDEPERAREHALKAVRDAHTFGTASAIGSALRLRAQVEDGQQAVELLEQAVQHLGQSPAGYEHAVALVDLGAALRRVGRLEDAQEHLYQGIELAQHCSAEGLVDRARRELANYGLRPNRLGLRDFGDTLESLSGPELEVAKRAVQGVPPQRIADELGVHISLVNRRLAAVYRKAGSGPDGLASALGLPAKQREASRAEEDGEE